MVASANNNFPISQQKHPRPWDCCRSFNNETMGQGEKYACAELMVDEIKSAGGIMPKVSQTLAMKPDVVKDRMGMSVVAADGLLVLTSSN